MVLLHVLHSLAQINRWQISVAHFNHHLRGHASAADEKLVRQTAAKLRIKFFAGGAGVKAFAAQSKISLEMAARKLRHDFFAQIAREQKISTVALAHHADDQVELFFLRLLRGAGGEGLAGMKWRSLSPMDKAVTLVRPLLGLSKAEILAHARAEKIQFRTDVTNLSADILRNRIRNELLPLLRKNYQPGLDKTVLRLMAITGAEAEFTSEAAEIFCSSRREEAQIKSGKRKAESGNKSWLPRAGSGEFADLSVAVQRKVLQQQLIGLGLLPDYELIEQLRAAPGRGVSVSPDLSVVRDSGGKIQLTKLSELAGTRFNAGELKLKLSVRAGQVEFDGLKLRWGLEKSSGSRRRFEPDWPSSRRPGIEFFDADKIGGEIILRHWRPGDRFQPIGMKSAVKLQDLFVNAKIPAARRRVLVLRRFWPPTRR